jgi:hypothetical protein
MKALTREKIREGLRVNEARVPNDGWVDLISLACATERVEKPSIDFIRYEGRLTFHAQITTMENADFAKQEIARAIHYEIYSDLHNRLMQISYLIDRSDKSSVRSHLDQLLKDYFS